MTEYDSNQICMLYDMLSEMVLSGMDIDKAHSEIEENLTCAYEAYIDDHQD